MAAEGMRFTDFYSAAEVCTPSRAALLTGRYPIRSGMCHDRCRVLRRDSTGGLPAEEITIAQALKTRGYATACIGKWHLGNYANDPAHHPRRHGFDFYFGLPHSNDMNPTPAAPKGAASRLDQQAEWWAAPLYRNEELIERPADQTTLTRRYTEEAVQFIRDHKSGPFFLYLAHTFPHVPLFASGQVQSGQSRRGLYGDVVEEIDWSVGQVLDTLRREGLDKNTLVFFTSDNGPWLTQGEAGGSAGLLRDGKGSTWEGGMREPGIAWWPGRVPAGVVTHELACTMDLFTTSLKLAGAEVPTDRVIDGVDHHAALIGHGAESAAGLLLLPRHTALRRTQGAASRPTSSPKPPTVRTRRSSTIRRCCFTSATIPRSGSTSAGRTFLSACPMCWPTSPRKSSATGPRSSPSSRSLRKPSSPRQCRC